MECTRENSWEIGCPLRWALIDLLDDRFPGMCRVKIAEWAMGEPWEDVPDSLAPCEAENEKLGSCWCGKLIQAHVTP